MRYRIVRAFLALMIVIPAVAGLHRSVVASVPLAVDVSDGYTFSGVQRSMKNGAINEFFESPIGPFSISGERGFVQLSWNRGQVDSFLNCDPAQFLRSISDTIQNRQTNHYSVDLSGTSGQIESIYLNIPTFENNGVGTTAPFPLEDVTINILYYYDGGQQVSGTMTPVTPQQGNSLTYARLGTDIHFENVGSILYIDVTFEGEVEPPLSGNPQTSSLNCPAPNEDFEESTDFGVTQLFFFDPHLVVNVAESEPNQPPVFDLQGTTNVVEGETANAVLTISDPDGDPIQVDVPPIHNTPCSLTVNDPSPDVVEITFNCPTTPGDAGTYVFNVSANDGTQTVTRDVVITVVEPPASLDPIADVAVDEGETVTFQVTGSNLIPDGAYTLTPELPGFGSATAFENGTAQVTLSPDYDDAGVYMGSLTLTDDADPEVTDTKTFSITVNNVNRPPTFDQVGNQQVVEGESIFGTITAHDLDGDSVALSGQNLPSFCTVLDNGDNSATFECNPQPGNAGVYTVTIVGFDGTDQVSTTFNVTVLVPNQPPVLEPISDRQIAAGGSGQVEVQATDPDNHEITLTPSNLPPFASLQDNGDGTGTVSYSPGTSDAGVYFITVTATDNGVPNLSDSKTFTLTVTDDESPSFDNLAQLTREVVRNPIVERVLLTIVNLADFFDEQGNEAAAKQLLRTFIRLVEGLSPFIIAADGAEELIEMAEELLEEYD